MSIIVFLVILVVLILVHEWGHFFVAKRFGIRVDEFGIGFPPKIWGKKRGETEYSVNALPFGGFVRIWGENPEEATPNNPDYRRSFIAQPKLKQAAVLFAGVAMNIVFAWVLFTVGFLVGMPSNNPTVNPADIKEERVVVTAVVEESPAARAGLAAGDTILAINAGGDMLAELSPEAISNFIQEHSTEKLSIIYSRGGKERISVLEPETGIVAGEPQRAAIGISMGSIPIVQLPLWRAMWESLLLSGDVLYRITIAVGSLIIGAFTLSADLSQITGPVGIVGLVDSVSALGFISLLSFTAFISLNLAVINLLPLPALDGGRLFFLAIEAVKGSPIRPKVAHTANMIGFALLILLMIIVTYNDILRLF